jgi:hypothetical protein
LFFSLHNLFIGHLLLLFGFITHLHFTVVRLMSSRLKRTTKDITFLHPLQRLLTKVNSAIFVDSERVLMPVDASLVKIESFRVQLSFFLLVLDEVILHELGVSAWRAYHLGLFVSILRVLVALERFCSHALQHFVGKVHFASVVLHNTLLLARLIRESKLGDIFEKCL